MAKQKLLVVDDSLTIQKVIRLALAQEAYEIKTVSDLRSGIEATSLFQPHVILVNVQLPDGSAFDFKKQIDEHNDLPPMKVILMSSAFETIDESKVKKSEFDGTLVKPFDPALLRQTLSQVLEKNQGQTKPYTPKAPKISLSEENAKISKDDDLWSEGTLDHQDDIKKLTETTIQMSGLDELDWSVDDSALKKQHLELPEEEPTVTTLKATEPELKPLPAMTQSPVIEESENEFKFDLEFPEDEPIPEISIPGESVFPSAPTTLESHEPAAVPIGNDELQSIISQQLQETIERMTREIFPELAEKIIKEEIHKMLSNPPND
ncbi:MAG: hypothetical protein CL678_09835 [Bdellovibrionaceae bacterium]|nr:hypothetical protein [Pseudobdellovibrionaceae bacterium]|tara:strand:- start:2934 stop:3896 length:963 start_codon:yes stop_codon:yes gene_type:complete